MSNNKMRTDGLCNAAITMRAHHLLSTVCTLGGAECPLLEQEEAREILNKVKRDPTISIKLLSNADEIPHYTTLSPEDCSRMDRAEVFNRKRDLDVLQRLGLVPGSVRRVRYLYTLLFERIETPDGICAYDTPGWEGCALARSGAYESVRAKGWKAVSYGRSEKEIAEWQKRTAERLANDERLQIRAHHLMCLCCWYAGGTVQKPEAADTLYRFFQRIRKEPEVPITVVEGPCMLCGPCEGFHPETGRCVRASGLIRDYHKDLDVLQKLGLMPGATMKARELFNLLIESISSTRDVCGYGDGVVRSEEWRICGEGPDGNPGYKLTRQTGIF